MFTPDDDGRTYQGLPTFSLCGERIGQLAAR